MYIYIFHETCNKSIIQITDQMDSQDGSGDNPPSKRLSRKVAVITGGARGIGAATAKVFAENGAYVVIADLLDELGTKLADSIGARYIHCNVSVESDMERAVQVALDWKGRLDIMFNNAGVGGPTGSITNIKIDQLMALMNVNLYGIVLGIKYAARAMIKGKHGGSIICSSSSAAVMGGLASHAYTMSKDAILGLARTSATELGVYGIRVNCILPHGVPSELLLRPYRVMVGNPDLQPEDVTRIVGERASLLKGRGGTMNDVAQAVLFLASDESGFITAHNLVIDGGYTVANNLLSYIYEDMPKSLFHLHRESYVDP